MSDKVMMACGHTSNGFQYTENGPITCCVICGCTTTSEDPDLTGRSAKCSDCVKVTDSKMKLPFFRYCWTKPFDEYYCGCRGWD